MRREDRWVPVAESGDRWKGRSQEAAEECLRSVPASGAYTSGDPWDGITHIEHEARYVTEWVVIQPGDLPDDPEAENLTGAS